jgi:hypothetical protein
MDIEVECPLLVEEMLFVAEDQKVEKSFQLSQYSLKNIYFI